jgi:2-polyprenyl-6-methoxyphenol hydroxylase-like FAD-dependent oxidoreductase
MLLARKGYRVLAVDRATFPSDTLSTHVVHAPGIAALQRWGLLDAVVSTGCPPINGYSFDFGPFAIEGTSRPVDGIRTAYAPRRTVLDQILVDGAAAAGVEVREDYNVDDYVRGDHGEIVGIRQGSDIERARIVIGADGRGSHLAKLVAPETYNTRPALQYGFYTYFSGLPTDRMEPYIRTDRAFGVAPTNDGLTMVVIGWPYAERKALKADVDANFMSTLRLVPDFADRIAGATREAPFLGGAVPGYFRKPYGDGWALVGDAAYNKDPITAQGITDAFHDAERCSAAVDTWLSGRSSFEDAMSAWHRERDEKAMPIYEFTSQMATLEAPPPEMLALLGAVHGNQDAMDDFASVVSGAVSPVEFFAEDNIGRIMAAAAAPVG